MGPLEDPRAQRGQAELVVLALERKRLLGPGAGEDLERLRAPGAGVIAPQAVAHVLVLAVEGAPPDAAVEAPAAQVVDRRELDSQPDRMPERELDHREADADPRRPHGERARERDRIRVDSLAGEVVLGEPHAVEAERLRVAG